MKFKPPLVLAVVLLLTVIYVGWRFYEYQSEAPSTADLLEGGQSSLALNAPTGDGAGSVDRPRRKAPQKVSPDEGLAAIPLSVLVARVDASDPSASFEVGRRAVRCLMLSAAVSRAQIDSTEERETAQFLAECEEMPREYLADPISLVREAAEAGLVEAQVSFSALASYEMTPEYMATNPLDVEEFKSDSLRFLRMAANEGSVDALNELAHIYANGVIASQDRIRAYAYMRAVQRSGLVTSAGLLVTAWGESLTTKQLAEAEKISRVIYKECCQ